LNRQRPVCLENLRDAAGTIEAVFEGKGPLESRVVCCSDAGKISGARLLRCKLRHGERRPVTKIAARVLLVTLSVAPLTSSMHAQASPAPGASQTHSSKTRKTYLKRQKKEQKHFKKDAKKSQKEIKKQHEVEPKSQASEDFA
jgi:hypothetical protein